MSGVRACKTCQHKHRPPTGKNCGMSNLTEVEFEALGLEKLQPGPGVEPTGGREEEESPTTPPHKGALTRHTAKKAQSASAADRKGHYGSLFSLDLNDFDDADYEEDCEEDDYSVSELRGLVEEQQQELTFVRGDIAKLSATLKGLGTVVGAGFKRLGAYGGQQPNLVPDTVPGRPAPGPHVPGRPVPDIPVSDSSLSSESSGSRRRRRRRRRAKRVVNMDILRYLPDGQDKPRSFAQLNSCLCSLLERHVEKGTENALKLLTHMRYLSDRSADTIHHLDNILLYDADARKLASTKGMQVLEYGITPLMNKHLGLNSLKTSGGTNKSAASSLQV